MNWRFFIIFIIFPLGITSCDSLNLNTETKGISTAELKRIDREFSAMSQRVGMRKAFLHYMEDEGVLLREGYMPIVGADAIEFLSQINDTAYTITWEPMEGGIAKSGDLGYTYGTYRVSLKDTVVEGNYVHIWRREEGEWRFVLDSGNQGISKSIESTVY